MPAFQHPGILPQICFLDVRRRPLISSSSIPNTPNVISSNTPRCLSQPSLSKPALPPGESFRPLTNSRLIKSVKRKYNISAETYFLGLSADSPRKNFLHLIKSFCCFARQNPENKSALVIAGSNTEKIKSRLREIENYKNFASRIIFTGYVDNADLAPLYNGALAFVYPSLYEGFGLPVLEAMQCGTPVICADNSSLPEVGGKAPLYISADDEQETAAALKTIS